MRTRIATVPGVATTRAHYVRRVFQEGGQWRLGVLTDAQTAAIVARRPQPASDLAAEPTPEEWSVLEALAEDVRRPLAQIRERTGGSLAAVSRRVTTLLGADWAHWRIDVAHRALGYECAVMLWVRAPQENLEQIATSFRLLPESRLIASVTGPANLAISLWLRDLADLDDLEQRVAKVYPSCRSRTCGSSPGLQARGPCPRRERDAGAARALPRERRGLRSGGGADCLSGTAHRRRLRSAMTILKAFWICKHRTNISSCLLRLRPRSHAACERSDRTWPINGN